MIDYSEYKDNEEFMYMLDYVRGNCLVDIDQLIDSEEFEEDFIREHFKLIQAIVAEEMQEGILNTDETEIVCDYIDDIL